MMLDQVYPSPVVCWVRTHCLRGISPTQKSKLDLDVYYGISLTWLRTVQSTVCGTLAVLLPGDIRRVVK